MNQKIAAQKIAVQKILTLVNKRNSFMDCTMIYITNSVGHCIPRKDTYVAGWNVNKSIIADYRNESSEKYTGNCIMIFNSLNINI